MNLVVGLGNPGSKYASTRHNVGFMVVDELLRRAAVSPTARFKGEVARARVGRTEAIVLKPATYMNLSGESVGACARYFRIEVSDVVVIHDELDLDYGDVRIKLGGGSAGHNGLKSITQHMGADFVRVRFGIGRPQHGTPTDYVLGRFSADERIDLEDHVARAADMVQAIVADGARSAMNQFNRRSKA